MHFMNSLAHFRRQFLYTLPRPSALSPCTSTSQKLTTPLSLSPISSLAPVGSLEATTGLREYCKVSLRISKHCSVVYLSNTIDLSSVMEFLARGSLNSLDKVEVVRYDRGRDSIVPRECVDKILNAVLPPPTYSIHLVYTNVNILVLLFESLFKYRKVVTQGDPSAVARILCTTSRIVLSLPFRYTILISGTLCRR